jgi:hypothetical protein
VTEEGDTTGEFSSDVLEPVRASFEKQGLMRLIGAEVVEAGRDGA